MRSGCARQTCVIDVLSVIIVNDIVAVAARDCALIGAVIDNIIVAVERGYIFIGTEIGIEVIVGIGERNIRAAVILICRVRVVVGADGGAVMLIVEIHERIEFPVSCALAIPILCPIARVLVIIGIGAFANGEDGSIDGDPLSADIEDIRTVD